MSKIVVTQGENPTLNLFAKQDGDNFDISGASASTTSFPGGTKANPKIVFVTDFTLIDGPTGHYRVNLTAAQLNQMRIGDDFDFNSKLTIGADTIYIWFDRSFRVRSPRDVG